jgi:hypothetical protein
VRKYLRGCGIAMALATHASLCGANPIDAKMSARVIFPVGPRSSLATGSSKGNGYERESSSRRDGHYEWRRETTHGPRAPIISIRRVWVADI